MVLFFGGQRERETSICKDHYMSVGAYILSHFFILQFHKYLNSYLALGSRGYVSATAKMLFSWSTQTIASNLE